MTKLWIAAGIVFAAWLHIHLTDQAYQQGYEDAEMALGTTAEQCFAWWFGNNRKQFEHEMQKFCKRSDT